MEPVTGVGGKLRREKPGHAHSPYQHKVELGSFFRNFPAEIGPEGPAGEFRIRPETTQGDECVLDSWRKADAMGQERFLELKVDHLRAEGDLPPVPAIAEGIGQSHHPRRHQCRSMLFGCVKFSQAMREHIAGSESYLLCADGDRWRDLAGLSVYH